MIGVLKKIVNNYISLKQNKCIPKSNNYNYYVLIFIWK
jgi:hypothetical protein